MNEIVFLLEEESAKVMLEGLLKRLLPQQKPIAIRYIVFEGKSDMDKQLTRRLRGYLNPKSHFIVLRDKDAADCKLLKQELRKKCDDAGKSALIRIVCHELESWYLGDLQAVESGLEIKNLAKKQENQKYRDPDKLANATQELTRLTEGVYQKIGGSRAIGVYLEPDKNRSHSFKIFIMGLRRLLSE